MSFLNLITNRAKSKALIEDIIILACILGGIAGICWFFSVAFKLMGVA